MGNNYFFSSTGGERGDVGTTSYTSSKNAIKGFSKVISENIVNDIFYIIISNIEKNKKIKIASFGTFIMKRKKSRIGRNPKTKEKKIISSRIVLTFKASKIFKNKINLK